MSNHCRIMISEHAADKRKTLLSEFRSFCNMHREHPSRMAGIMCGLHEYKQTVDLELISIKHGITMKHAPKKTREKELLDLALFSDLTEIYSSEVMIFTKIPFTTTE